MSDADPFAVLARRQWRGVLALEIDGLEAAWYTAGPKPTGAATGGVSRDWRTGLVSVTGGEQSLDLTTGAADHGPVTVAIADTGAYARGGNGAEEQLLRLGPQGSTWQAPLYETLDKEAPGASSETLTVLGDHFAALSPSGVVWVGEEAVAYSSVALLASPARTRLQTLTRGEYGSRTQRHTVDALLGDPPIVTAECVSWRGRRARVRMAAAGPDGAASTTWVDVVAGFIDSTPSVDADGVVTLVIVPFTAALTQPIAAVGRAATMVPGYHVFDGLMACSVEASEVWPVGAAFDESLSVGYGAGSTDLQIGDAQAKHSNVFDIAAAKPERAGRVLVDGTNQISYDVTAYPASDEIRVDPALSDAAPFGARVRNAGAADWISVYWATLNGGQQLKAWPDECFAALNSNTGLSRTSHLDAGAGDPGWANVRVDAAGILARLNTLGVTPGALSYELGRQVRVIPQAGDAFVWRWWRRAANPWDAEANTGLLDVSATQHSIEVTRDRLDWYALASAWHQGGEKYVLLSDDLTVGATASTPAAIEVEFSQIFGGRVWRSSYLWLVRDTADQMSDGGTAVGYATPDGEGTPHFADYPAAEGWSTTTFRRVVYISGVDVARALAQLLQSDVGNGENGAFDVQPAGARLTTGELDVQSFVGVGSPPFASSLELRIREAASPMSVLGGVMRLAGLALVSRVDRSDGRARVQVSAIRRANPTQSVASWDSSHFVGPLDTATDERTVNRLDLKAYTRQASELYYPDARDAKPDAVEVVVDARSAQQDAAGEVSAQSADLRGVELDASGSDEARRLLLGPALAQLRRVQLPRRVWSGSVLLRAVVGVAVGDTVTVTHPHARAYSGARGVTAVPALVTGLSPDYAAGVAHVELTYHGALTTGWAPALQVESVVSATVIKVAANSYTAAAHPLTGATQTDLDYWQAGDDCLCVPFGNYAGRAARSIVSVDTGTRHVELDGAHGLTVSDSIRPAAYDSMRTAVQQFAFLADSAGTLGAAGDPGYEYD